MAKSKKRKGGSASPLQTRVVVAVLLATSGVLFAIALIAYLQDGNWRADASDLAPRMGRVNFLAARSAVAALGVLGAWLGAVLVGVAAVRVWMGRPLAGVTRRTVLFVAAGVLLASAFFALPGGPIPAERALFSGWIGSSLVQGLRALFGGIGATVALVGLIAAYLATVGVPIFAPLARLSGPLAGLADAIGNAFLEGVDWIREAFDFEGAEDEAPAPRNRKGKRPKPEADASDDFEEDEEADEPVVVATRGSSSREWVGPAAEAVEVPDDDEDDELEEIDEYDEEENGLTSIPENVPVLVLPSAGEPEEKPAERYVAAESLRDLPAATAGPYQRPPGNFLEQDEEESDEDASHREGLLESAKLLEKTLHSFGVKGKVTQVQPGPVITRYEIEPAVGQKVAPIANLADDLALALKARAIRVVAPIPGKAAVGIEVPNARPKIVRLGSLLETPEYQDDESPLNIALGRTISGEPFCAALDRMPHVLVAGATGAGKSVCINTIITSILYRSGPEDVRFVMVDPKMLELMSYAGLPHVIPPIVTQPKEAVKILKWAVGEMEARYRTLAHVGVRSITDYNKRLVAEGASTMPYLVVIVDELADLMLSNQKSEIEDHIARLAQMARAVGIHLVVATQRPSVDVITGVIKANFPSRIAFQVPTRTDSRTILDSIGAEKLLGKGDMLYLGVGMSSPMRVHGSFISTEETNDVVEWLKNRNPRPVSQDEADSPGPLDDGNELFPMEREDDLFEEAARILVAHQQGSISLLQRRLKVGYARAARLVDMMEEAGIVGPFTGSKARDILVPTVEDLERLLAASQRAPLGGKAGN
jgi:S-DNA-T family DNA segregation ATPase FtsK/SpoIIIE